MHLANNSEAASHALPPRLDCETAALVRGFLRPIFERAQTWADLVAALSARGYDLVFREGRLVILSHDDGRPLCTGRDLGEPLADLAARFGRLQLKTGRDGRSGWIA
ncbi:hypothetical protein SAMN05421759_104311 [Roseivivax lentus]|uniref:Uncharacterized protein n=1 Tax=Roseivivax lentus TaxID=633194 RepID=A0A1N7MGM1_9RHOB|nr:hypothetical protein [Roseivivax lentus]SIS85296.1 hypothetical protein SAMN05421759_104311 [Roseivivax lentus]